MDISALASSTEGCCRRLDLRHRNSYPERMDFQKLDGALASSLSEHAGRPIRLPVFLQLRPPLSEEARRMLSACGIQGAGDDTVLPADLDARQVAELSDQSWVVSIRMAQKTRMLR